jgi:hypothetical protein
VTREVYKQQLAVIEEIEPYREMSLKKMMKRLQLVFLVLLFQKLNVAQTGVPLPSAPSSGAAEAAELQALREALTQTREQLGEQQREIEALKQDLPLVRTPQS